MTTVSEQEGPEKCDYEQHESEHADSDKEDQKGSKESEFKETASRAEDIYIAGLQKTDRGNVKRPIQEEKKIIMKGLNRYPKVEKKFKERLPKKKKKKREKKGKDNREEPDSEEERRVKKKAKKKTEKEELKKARLESLANTEK
ncbi:glutamic acid-rich protein-like [Capsicum annuum]|uniref:glutamic acid-rich protein-like n=1 Tax=Capsicum annuum TaxID=4072 RepID=UPI001FB0EDA8|nr:glutamic acid-rich protein-like [Capsicum annuum]